MYRQDTTNKDTIKQYNKVNKMWTFIRSAFDLYHQKKKTISNIVKSS